MQRTLYILACLALLAGTAVADDVMGNWEGEYTTASGEKEAVTAQVIAQGNDTYRALVRYVKSGVEAPPLEWLGHREGDKVLFTYGDKPIGAIHKGSSPTLGAKPPEGAVVLLDGTNLDAWERWPLKWIMVEEGAMQVAGSNLVTKQEFGDCRIHLEFRTPFMPDARGQGRGNSGVYVQGRYEVQVLDSFGLEPADNGCGGIYKIATPKVNACLPPLEWQTYDIDFKAPRFDASGRKTQNAVITVRHNGELIHDAVVLETTTPGGITDKEGATGPLLLQDHHDPVRYRNIWVVPQ